MKCRPHRPPEPTAFPFWITPSALVAIRRHPEVFRELEENVFEHKNGFLFHLGSGRLLELVFKTEQDRSVVARWFRSLLLAEK